MTTFTKVPLDATVHRSWRALAGRIGLWTVSTVLAVQFAFGGVLKLTADSSMVGMFDDIGAGQGLRLLVGACEVAGAIGLLVPRLARLAATGLVLLMFGAALTNIVILYSSPVLPVVFGVIAGVVAVFRNKKEIRR